MASVLRVLRPAAGRSLVRPTAATADRLWRPLVRTRVAFGAPRQFMSSLSWASSSQLTLLQQHPPAHQFFHRGPPKRFFSAAAASPVADEAVAEAGEPAFPVTLAPSAYQRLKELETQLGHPVTLRLLVDAGGCEGFSYKFTMEKEELDPEVDRVIDPALAISSWNEAEHASKGKRRRAQAVTEGEDPAAVEVREPIASRLVVDDSSINFLRGATIGYTQDLIKSVFEVVHNPNVDSTCGCNTSFSVGMS